MLLELVEVARLSDLTGYRHWSYLQPVCGNIVGIKKPYLHFARERCPVLGHCKLCQRQQPIESPVTWLSKGYSAMPQSK